MATSSEYKDLRWIPPASFSGGRPQGPPRFIVIHTTEGSSHGSSAEDGAAYDARRTDGTSTHYFVDSDSVVQCVRTGDRAHTAGYTGNLWGIQYELCARAGYNSTWWAGAYAQAMLRRAAKQAARDVRKYGIPVKRITPADLRAGGKGFVGHVDVTNAWREVDHTDPGPNFPWSTFLKMVQDEINPPPANPAADEEEDMPSFTTHVIPHGFAYDAAGDVIARENAISVPLPPAGLGAYAGKNLHISVSSDHEGDVPLKVRVAINNGGWNVKTVEVKAGPRVTVPVAPTTNNQAFTATVGRVTSDKGEHVNCPAGILFEIA